MSVSKSGNNPTAAVHKAENLRATSSDIVHAPRGPSYTREELRSTCTWRPHCVSYEDLTRPRKGIDH